MNPKSSSKRFSSGVRRQLLTHLSFLYGKRFGEGCVRETAGQIESTFGLLLRGEGEPPRSGLPFDESTVALIAYADMVQRHGEAPLKTLGDFLQKHLAKTISVVHLLPFFPYSSDHGFSVLDYKSVDPNLGTWKDVLSLSRNQQLIFDLVLNHVSSQSKWFQNYLKGHPIFAKDFIEKSPNQDYSSVFRPRESTLFTPFKTAEGKTIHVWTTFGPDQVDLNYGHPKVLLEMLEVVAAYVRMGAVGLRLDAVGFLWKKKNTPCIHLEGTHRLIKIFRLVVDSLSVPVRLIAETNVPHKENLSYFGDRNDEAHVVYQFALPPLVLHSFVRRDASALTSWAKDLKDTWNRNQLFLNFLASHDGVGVQPVKDILDEKDIQAMADHCIERGGKVSYKALSEHRKVIYELNINLLDAITEASDDMDLVVQKGLLAHSVMLVMPGMPAFYFHSLVGSRNDEKAVARTGEHRMINREKLQLVELESELKNPKSLRHKIYNGLTELVQLRKSIASFHPQNPFNVHDFGDDVFVLERFVSGNDEARVLALHNFSTKEKEIADLPEPYKSQGFVNLLTQEVFDAKGSLVLAGMGFLWLAPKDP